MFVIWNHVHLPTLIIQQLLELCCIDLAQFGKARVECDLVGALVEFVQRDARGVAFLDAKDVWCEVEKSSGMSAHVLQPLR